MEFKSAYTAKIPDENGYIEYTDEENLIWKKLFSRQMKLLPGRACVEHLEGLTLLKLSENHVPQLKDVSRHLKQVTQWEVVPVPALISAKEFFTLLSNRQFPGATFIRSMEDLDYVKEPDIFHELFGHCPMLTQPVFADFTQEYAKMVLDFPERDWPLLQRLFWFTVEFGLINTKDGVRSYGGGILSSNKETIYAVESNIPERKPFDALEALRTPYRIDQLQKIYFVIDSYDDLYRLIESEKLLPELLKKAYELGEFAPSFEVDPNNPSIHVNAC